MDIRQTEVTFQFAKYSPFPFRTNNSTSLVVLMAFSGRGKIAAVQ